MHYLRTTGYSLRLVTRCFGIQHQAKCSFASVNKSQLSKLRRATGYTFSACRDALVRHANHYDNALAWLEEEAVRLGWSKAGKLSGRSLTQGLVGVMETGDRVVMVEVNCETDFVARNEQFQNLVATTAEAVMNAYRASANVRQHWDAAELGALSHPNGGHGPLRDSMATVIGAVGENMLIRRACGLSCRSPDSSPLSSDRVASYAHMSTSGARHSVRDVRFGKYAAAIRYCPIGADEVASAAGAWSERAALLGKQLCQHIVGMNPRPGLELVDSADVAAAAGAVDPENDGEEEEQRLLLQPFFLDETVRVGEHLRRNDLRLEDFVRFECGQEEVDVAGLSHPA